VDIKLTLPEIERITWELLEEHPDVRPTMAEVAAVRGCSPLQIRRANERIQRIVGWILREIPRRFDLLLYYVRPTADKAGD
jgi:hypothetical protein